MVKKWKNWMTKQKMAGWHGKEVGKALEQDDMRWTPMEGIDGGRGGGVGVGVGAAWCGKIC